MTTKRIYIGGLTPDISQNDVAGRFKPFGQVLSCEIIKAKASDADLNSCRGFAYVNMQPKDEASLARMLSLVSCRV
jgi:RNA recognition motif-containing protein